MDFKRNFITTIFIVIISTIMGCGTESTSNSPPTLATISSQTTNQGVNKKVTISVNDSDADALNYTVDFTGGIGSVTGSILTLIPNSDYSGIANIQLRVSDGWATISQSFTLMVVAHDPLYQYQWHLGSGATKNFSANMAGAGLYIAPTIREGYSGTGVIVAVVDSGLEIAHEDLSENVVVNGSWDFASNDSDPTNGSVTGDHGTSVAGLIAAVGWNGKGGHGAAPNASLKGFNFLATQTSSNQVKSLGGASYSADVSIFNQSYGFNNTYDFAIGPAIEAQYLYGVSSLRNGKGAIYVKSAGNGFRSYASVDCATLYSSSPNYRTPCQNVNMDPENATPYNIVVGALSATNQKSSYSTSGSSIWIAAPGGEDGISYAALMTTDQSSCARGYVRNGGSSTNTFNTVTGGVGHSENVSCNYTSTFNGTSSAAPVISGVIALILEANPELTWRDVKHILASTADQVDSSVGTRSLKINGVSYVAEPDWLTNSAGYQFHNYFGFGKVDVANAVAAAKTYVPNSLGIFNTGSWISSGNVNLTIPDNNAGGVSDTKVLSESKIIEAVQIKVNLTHTYTGHLAIELTSPSGTKSILFSPLNGFGTSNDLSDMVLLSNAFYGESTSGNWTIKVIDALSGETGSLTNWSIRVFGH